MWWKSERGQCTLETDAIEHTLEKKRSQNSGALLVVKSGEDGIEIMNEAHSSIWFCYRSTITRGISCTVFGFENLFGRHAVCKWLGDKVSGVVRGLISTSPQTPRAD
jgi:hypothetical protein